MYLPEALPTNRELDERGAELEDEGGVEIYSTVRDDVEEISQLFTGSEDLSTEVQFAHRVNPVYNTRTASETQTLLRTSDVTFKSLNQSFKKNRIRWGDDRSPPPVPTSAPPSKERQNPLQILVKAVGRKFSSSQSENEVLSPEKGSRALSPEPTGPVKFGRKLPLLPPPSKVKGHRKTGLSGELVNSEPGLGPQTTRSAALKEGLTKSSDVLGQTHHTSSSSSSVGKPLSRPSRPGITKLGVVKMNHHETSRVYGQVDEPSKPPFALRKHPSLPPPTATAVEYIAPYSDDDNIQVEDYSEVFGRIKWTPPQSPTNTTDETAGPVQEVPRRKEPSHDYEDIDMETEEVGVARPPVPPARPAQFMRGRIHSDSVVYQDPSHRGGGVAEKGVKRPPQRTVVAPPPKPPRAYRKTRDNEESDGARQQPRLMKPGEILKVWDSQVWDS